MSMRPTPFGCWARPATLKPTPAGTLSPFVGEDRPLEADLRALTQCIADGALVGACPPVAWNEAVR